MKNDPKVTNTCNQHEKHGTVDLEPWTKVADLTLWRHSECKNFPSRRQLYLASRNYSDVIMSAMASQITGVSTVYSTVCSGADRSFASPAFVRGIHQWPVNSPHKGPVTQSMFPFDDIIMINVFHVLLVRVQHRLASLYILTPWRWSAFRITGHL